MSQRSKNQEEVNNKLMEFNEKYIPEYDVILNTAPPRAGKTINTILYHFKNDIPVIVFVDNKEQAEDIMDDLGEIDDYFKAPYYWQSKKDLCYILQNKKEIIKEHGKKFFELTKFKYNNGINICDNCKYRDDFVCDWINQKNSLLGNNLILMNKKNIETATVDNPNEIEHLKLFHKHDTSIDTDGEPRNIIYDEKLEQLHTIKFKELEPNELKLLNKIIKLKKPSTDVTIFDDQDFIHQIDFIKNIFKESDIYTYSFLKRLDFDFSLLGEFEDKIHFKAFLNNIKNNIEIHDYLVEKPAPLPKKGNLFDLEHFTYEKLYIDILFERMSEHKIILLDATPLKSIVEEIEKRESFKHITLKPENFDRNSSLLRINRQGKPAMASRDKIKGRTPNYKIPSALLQDKSYNNVIKTKKYIDEFKKQKDIKFGVITYKQLKSHKKDKDPIKPFEELKKVLKNTNTLYLGNTRGRSELNDCKILHIVGTDRNPSISMYNLYRYLGGRKTWEELEKSRVKGAKKLTYKDDLFNEIINHQIDSEMEQVIFRNMPHMKKRLTILEGHMPEHLKEYFKEVANINMKPTTEKLVYPIVIEEFLKALYYNKEFNFNDANEIAKLSFDTDEKILRAFNKRIKEESVEKVNKLINEYRAKPENYTFERIFDILKEKHFELLKKAKMGSFKSFKNKYNNKK